MNPKTLENRIEVLKAMHLIMSSMNDEDAYWRWVTCGVPDCPSLGDYEFIAEHDDEFNECAEFFEKILHTYIKSGLYCGN